MNKLSVDESVPVLRQLCLNDDFPYANELECVLDALDDLERKNALLTAGASEPDNGYYDSTHNNNSITL